MEGTGTTDTGEPALVEVEKLTDASGLLGDNIVDSATVTIGKRLEPTRSWEGFWDYDPDTGEATTFFGEVAEDGPFVVVDDGAVTVEGDFAVRDGLTPAEELTRGVITAACPEG